MLSEYWKNQGKSENDKRHGRTFNRGDGSLGCAECCNGDRCDDDTHFNRESCPFCLGTGTNATARLGTPISQLSGRPGHPGYEKFTEIAASWGYDLTRRPLAPRTGWISRQIPASSGHGE